MEPISFTLALGAIPSIFTSCVDAFKYVQYGRDFERDFGVTLCKLEASELRLTRWGAAMGIEGPGSKLAGPYGQEEIKSAYHWLREIEKSFDAAMETSARFKSRNSAKPERLRLLDSHAEPKKGDDPLRGLHGNMRSIIDGRLKPGKRNLVAWVLYKRGAYQTLVEDISELVDNLLELFPSTADKQAQLCKDEVKGMSSDRLKLLGDVIGDEDDLLKTVIETELEQRAIRVGEVRVADSFVGQIGDNVESAGQASSIDVGAVIGSGHSTLHIGSNIGTGGSVSGGRMEKKG
ncbi:uncharacterized protein DNG_05525 [Cephalotrichum gorgonifer]|uniref:Prion-inhibition and propagation HeLo domain-containing protein n=1 Tax=Cephalotrichum gorgonifer TaxID=2041049 RepID=A0AAE8SVL6_9PEZI|nr:uncharacterized protein DNG_05525 [Cephalotrichum gorgonifer]